MDEYIKTNQEWWNEAAQVHTQGDAYQLQAFKEGMSKLHPLERAEVGDVTGKNSYTCSATLVWTRFPGRA